MSVRKKFVNNVKRRRSRSIRAQPKLFQCETTNLLTIWLFVCQAYLNFEKRNASIDSWNHNISILHAEIKLIFYNYFQNHIFKFSGAQYICMGRPVLAHKFKMADDGKKKQNSRAPHMNISGAPKCNIKFST